MLTKLTELSPLRHKAHVIASRTHPNLRLWESVVVASVIRGENPQFTLVDADSVGFIQSRVDGVAADLIWTNTDW